MKAREMARRRRIDETAEKRGEEKREEVHGWR
jgi:hypothetical protein